MELFAHLDVKKLLKFTAGIAGKVDFKLGVIIHILVDIRLLLRDDAHMTVYHKD